jgi:hypothetical protein
MHIIKKTNSVKNQLTGAYDAVPAALVPIKQLEFLL